VPPAAGVDDGAGLRPWVCAGAAFLFAVLWMDLMFDVTVLATPDAAAALPEAALASIAGYYRRVTTDAAPMGHLIALVMVATFVATLLQARRAGGPIWLRVLPPLLVFMPTSLALTRVVPNAVRLGARSVSDVEQSALARTILVEHLFCLACIALLLLLELSGFSRARSRLSD